MALDESILSRNAYPPELQTPEFMANMMSSRNPSCYDYVNVTRIAAVADFQRRVLEL